MNKVVLITGSTRGIGKAVALRFAQEGDTVVVNGMHETAETKALMRDIVKLSPLSDSYFFDVSDQSQVEKNCQKILNRYSAVDILINNAGIVKNTLFSKMSYKEWDDVIKVNLYSVFLVTRQLLPVMIRRKWGRIINVTSVSGITGDFGQTNYSASKAGIIGFTKSLAREVARDNITVNAVCPGLVETEILTRVPHTYMKSLLEKIPLGRMAKPSEIVQLIQFLSSEGASYSTGSVVNITGGWI